MSAWTLRIAPLPDRSPQSSPPSFLESLEGRGSRDSLCRKHHPVCKEPAQTTLRFALAAHTAAFVVRLRFQLLHRWVALSVASVRVAPLSSRRRLLTVRVPPSFASRTLLRSTDTSRVSSRRVSFGANSLIAPLCLQYAGCTAISNPPPVGSQAKEVVPGLDPSPSTPVQWSAWRCSRPSLGATQRRFCPTRSTRRRAWRRSRAPRRAPIPKPATVRAEKALGTLRYSMRAWIRCCLDPSRCASWKHPWSRVEQPWPSKATATSPGRIGVCAGWCTVPPFSPSHDSAFTFRSHPRCRPWRPARPGPLPRPVPVQAPEDDLPGC